MTCTVSEFNCGFILYIKKKKKNQAKTTILTSCGLNLDVRHFNYELLKGPMYRTLHFSVKKKKKKKSNFDTNNS